MGIIKRAINKLTSIGKKEQKVGMVRFVHKNNAITVYHICKNRHNEEIIAQIMVGKIRPYVKKMEDLNVKVGDMITFSLEDVVLVGGIGSSMQTGEFTGKINYETLANTYNKSVMDVKKTILIKYMDILTNTLGVNGSSKEDCMSITINFVNDFSTHQIMGGKDVMAMLRAKNAE